VGGHALPLLLFIKLQFVMSEVLLNKEQKEAVYHTTGPLLVIAGAGTGKTSVITERVKNLVLSGVVGPSEILCLTFTEKASLEMEERIDVALPLGYSQLSVSTFHGFCDRVLRDHGFHIGIDPNYRLMTQAESMHFLSSNIFSLPLVHFRPIGNPDKFLSLLLNHFSRIADEDISVDEYAKWAYGLPSELSEDQKWTRDEYVEISNVWKEYSKLKLENSVCDFSDLITHTISLFRSRPNVLSLYHQKFPYILVDEYQDTNHAQHELVKMLAGKSKNITAVCDDDQSIYAFRGAAVANILEFTKTFEGTKVVTLNQNYRSHQEILDASYKLIINNNPERLEYKEKIDKKLVAQRGGGGIVEFAHLPTGQMESVWVKEKIMELVNSGYKFSDMAILVRANSHADQFVRLFEKEGVPFEYLGPGKLYERKEVSELVAFLRVMVDLYDDQSWWILLSSDTHNIDPLYIAELFSKSKEEATHVWDQLKIDEEPSVKSVVEFVKGVISTRESGAGKLLWQYIDQFGITQKLTSFENLTEQEYAQNITKLFKKVSDLEQIGVTTASSVISYIDMQLASGESPSASEIDWEDQNAVRVISAHSSKGLEFPVVFVVNLVAQRFPSVGRSDPLPPPAALIKNDMEDDHMREERRLMYVAMTRARDRLYLTAARKYEGNIREKKLSQFLLELGFNDEKTLESVTSGSEVKQNIDFEKVRQEVGKIKLSHLSYSQIETFRICPLHYKLNYILKVPQATSPGASFGNSFHRVLRSFYQEYVPGSVDQNTLMQQLLATHWIKKGYQNQQHEREAYQKAQDYLKLFLENWFTDSVNTIACEKPFAFKLADTKITGVIDRIDEVDGKLVIVDYKTGEKVMSQKEADKSLQLSIYALAATKIPEKPFAREIEDITLKLVYFSDPQVVVTKRSVEELISAENEILKIKEDIENSDFVCSGHPSCEFCEYKTFCKASQNNS